MDRQKVKSAASDGITPISKSQEFWGDPENQWPRDSTECLFLAAAVHEIGEAYFGSEWTFDEPVTIPKSERFVKVQDIIASGCQEKKLVCKTRAVAGGVFSDLEPDVWNVDDLSYRFQFCQMDPDDPCSVPRSDSYWYNPETLEARGRGYQLIFITRKSLQPFIDELEQTRQTPSLSTAIDQKIHLSPYMKMMLEIIEAWKISPENQHKKASLAQEFSSRWEKRYHEPLSQNLADAMASLVREPESQQGRAAKKADTR